MRGNKRDALMREERKTLEQKRSSQSKARSAKRKEQGRAEDDAQAIQRTPAAKKAAATLKAKRGAGMKKEQADYQTTRARSAARMGGKRKQNQAALNNRTEQ